MLRLEKVVKNYVVGENIVNALKDVDLAFRRSEFVSILGPSGCGKTTMLNIIGGLDRYTSGNLFIDGKSTKEFTSGDWDAYRNHSIGFVFQSYNLIPHLNILKNVELALTISGISKNERKERAAKVLQRVGLEEQLYKMPNQLSGGQMQRVSIARALVNDPEIILADEPTGALDTVTSVQVTDILKEISQDRLVIMVTHNEALAQKYSTRIVKLLDGKIIDDSNPYTFEQELVEKRKEKEADLPKRKWYQIFGGAKKRATGKTSMSFWTALSLSFKNLVSKRGRTIMTSVAGSIGIIGVALVLAVSNGFTGYINRMQSEMLAGYPMTIDKVAVDLESMHTAMHEGNKLEEFPEGDNIIAYNPNSIKGIQVNQINKEYTDYLKSMNSEYYNNLQLTSGVQMNVIARSQNIKLSENLPSTDVYLPVVSGGNDDFKKQLFGPAFSSSFGTELLSNTEFLKSQYEIIGNGSLPQQPNEVVIVVDKYNRLSTTTLLSLGIFNTENLKFQDLMKAEMKLIHNDAYYSEVGGAFKPNFTIDTSGDISQILARILAAKPIAKGIYENESSIDIKVSGVLRVKEDATLDLLSPGIYYSPKLADLVIERSENSKIYNKQKEELKKADPINVLTGDVFSSVPYSFNPMLKPLHISEDMVKQTACQILGVEKEVPYSVTIYPKSFESKGKIINYLNAYNYNADGTEKPESEHIIVTDMASVVTTTMTTLVDTISYVLIAFASISLLVSSIMIGIITYVSVVERTKEIGVLRSIGARKRDISRVFNAETMIVGFAAGLIGVIIAFILTWPISAIVLSLSSGMVAGIASLNIWHALLLVVISVLLTTISGLIPARIASKKDPVEALRS